MSPGSAWIVREILEAHPRPGSVADTFDPRSRMRVAWKTGTSYGYRDAWSVGFDGRITIGVWVGRPDGAPVPGLVEQLTARELEVLVLLAAGMPNPRIAEELVVSLDTVKKHVSHLLGKLGAANRTEAVTRARELGLTP